MLKVAIWGFGNPVLDTIKCLLGKKIEIVYVKCDYCRPNVDEYQKEVNRIGLPFFIEDVPNIEVDLIFAINYNRIVPEEILKKYRIINYHVGILPMWRGNSANGWGIINGAASVGYTIHEMVPMLDAGPIYYQFAYPYMEGETYISARVAMAYDFRNKLAKLLEDIHVGNIESKKQIGPFTYCSTFRPIDGYINWEETTDLILRRFYVFGPPLGSGLKFLFKSNEYIVTRISRIEGFAAAIGIPGSVVYKTGRSVWVKTGDSAISIDEVTKNNEVIDLSKEFMIGQRF